MKIENKKVSVIVKDNGPGIDEEIQSKIFDPFYTTKPVGQGTGLGLSICHSIVERHGGTISLDSKVGQGTTFTVTIPIHDRPKEFESYKTESIYDQA